MAAGAVDSSRSFLGDLYEQCNVNVVRRYSFELLEEAAKKAIENVENQKAVGRGDKGEESKEEGEESKDEDA